jgi:hypothetical protein
MDFDPRDLDAEFITVDADTPFGDVRGLVDELSPTSIVVREAAGFGDLDDDEDDVFYVFEPGSLLGLDAPATTRIGELAAAEAARAPAFEHGAGGGSAGAWMADVAAGAEPAVLLSAGVPERVTRSTRRRGGGGAPPDGGEGGGDGDGGDGGGALGLAVDYPKSVALEATLSLLIRLTADLSGADVIPFVAAAGDRIDVFVSPESGFVVEGRPDGELVVTVDAEPLPIQVKLRATSTGPGTVTVYAFREGAALGALKLRINVRSKRAGARAGDERASAQERLGDATAPDADLQLVILEQRDAQNRPALQFLLTGRDPKLGLNLKPFGPTVLEAGPGGYFTDLYRDIEKLPLKTEQEKAEATERLHAVGSTLFTELVPADLQTLLWELRERITTVWIQSAEPYVPWELCRLQGMAEDETVVEGEFFCEAFALTRWIPGIGRVPELSLSSMGLIVPDDSGLENAERERQMVHALAGSGRAVTDIPPTYLGVRKALAGAEFDGLHFSGHGQFPDQANPAKAEIELEGGKKLRPSDISGVAANLGRRHPVVFFNACQVGRQAPGLTGIGGWASALLRNGAAAFVGSHWEVADDLALTFASTFYAQLDGGASVAAAAREARLAIRDAGDPTWLAYTVFADPGAKLAA